MNKLIFIFFIKYIKKVLYIFKNFKMKNIILV